MRLVIRFLILKDLGNHAYLHYKYSYTPFPISLNKYASFPCYFLTILIPKRPGLNVFSASKTGLHNCHWYNPALIKWMHSIKQGLSYMVLVVCQLLALGKKTPFFRLKRTRLGLAKA